MALSNDSNSELFGHLAVDGQNLVVPMDLAWRELVFNPTIDGKPLAVPKLVFEAVEFARTESDFQVALIPPGSVRKSWLFCLLERGADGWQRVHIEILECTQCGWRGVSANPFVTDLYIGVTDKDAALRKASSRERKRCPNCGSALPRDSIWTGPQL